MLATATLWVMEHIGSLLPLKVHLKSEKEQREILIAYFAKKMGWSKKGMYFKLVHLKELRDLYYIKSDCDQAEARGVPWPAAFRDALHLSKKYKVPVEK